MMLHALHNKSKKGHKHTKSLYISIKSKSNDYQNKNKNMVHRIKIPYTMFRLYNFKTVSLLLCNVCYNKYQFFLHGSNLLNVVCKFSDKLKTSLQNSVTLNLIISITSFPVVNYPSYIIRLYANSSFLISTNVISSAWKSLFYYFV